MKDMLIRAGLVLGAAVLGGMGLCGVVLGVISLYRVAEIWSLM